MGSVTIRDIAHAAGISVATVSRALNHSPSVSDAMQERVFQTARQLGYVPNATAKSLKTNSTNTIGVLVSDISNPDYISIVRTIEDIVSPYGYSLILCSTGDSQQRELNYLNMLYSRGVDGLILNTTEQNNDLILKMCEHIPTVLLNRNIQDPRFHGDYIATDNYAGIYQLTNFLLSLGHRDIYIVKGPSHLRNNHERFQGFCAAMQEMGYQVDDDYPFSFSGDYAQQTGISAVRKILAMPQHPSAILTFSNITMLGVLSELSHSLLSRRIPEEVSLASYDSLPNLDLLSIRPVTAQFNNHDIGDKCAHAILERISDPALPNRKFIFKPVIVPGNAVGFAASNQLKKE